MEKRDLYDKNRNLTGETIFKGEPIPEGKYIIVILVTIQNSKGEFLVQKRSKQKDGKYAFTGGHVKTGETSIEGMMAEIKEEIGLSVEPEELELIFSDLNISELVLQEEEVESVQWSTLEEIEKLINNDKFLINHAEEVYRTIDIFKQRGRDITK